MRHSLIVFAITIRINSFLLLSVTFFDVFGRLVVRVVLSFFRMVHGRAKIIQGFGKVIDATVQLLSLIHI